MSRTIEIVDTPKALAQLADSLSATPGFALDTEGNSRHRYPEQLCLVQIAAGGRVYVVDPLAIGREVQPLGELLADDGTEKVIHSVDYDLRSLDREWGFRVRNVFDTSVAARLCGARRLGLETVLDETLGVKINKEKRLQQSDWSRRPLSEEALAYAAGDVRHLMELQRVLRARLGALGRTSWLVEECRRLEAIRHTPPDPPEVAFLSVKGTRELDGKGLAVLRELYVLRDGEARRRLTPPYRIVGNDALLHLAANPEDELTAAPGIGPVIAQRLGAKLRQAINRGLKADPVERPKSVRSTDVRLTKQQEDRLRALKAWRNAEGERLDVDAALVWPMPSLERLAHHPDEIEDEVEHSTAIRQWQRREFEASLRQSLERAG